MKKLSELRDYFLSFPKFIDANDLLTFAEQGSVSYHRVPSTQQNTGFFDDQAAPGDDSFQIRYQANLIVTDFVGDFNALCFLLNLRLGQIQPGLKEDDIKFHVDIMDNSRQDVSFQFPLSEIIAVIPRDGGGHDVEAIASPDAFDFKMM